MGGGKLSKEITFSDERGFFEQTRTKPRAKGKSLRGKKMPSDYECRQCSTGVCMGARRRRRDTTTTTFDTMSWQQWSLMGEFKEGGWSQIEGQVSGGQEGGSNSSRRSSRRVRRAAGTSNSWATEDPHTKAVLNGIQAGSNEGNQGKDVSPEAVD